MHKWVVQTASANETEAVGERLGQRLPPGTVVGLIGPLGAGKTHLTRGLARGLGVDHPEQVNSPTFVLIQEYPGTTPLFHFDTYRLPDPAAFAELGIEEYFASGGVCVVEWADRVSAWLPEERITITLLHAGETSRVIEVEATGQYERLLES